MTETIFSVHYDLSELDDLIPQIWDRLKGYAIITLSGDLGAGKTTFTTHLCRYLGVKDAASSPTFTLVNEYVYTDETGQLNTLYHIDLYRVRDAEEAIQAGIEDCILQARANTHTKCLIEWAARAPELIPTPHADVALELHTTPTARTLRIIATK